MLSNYILCDHSPHSYLCQKIIEKDKKILIEIIEYNKILDINHSCTIIVPDPEKYAILEEHFKNDRNNITIWGVLYPNPVSVSWSNYIRLSFAMLYGDTLLNGLIKTRPLELESGISEKTYYDWIEKLSERVPQYR